LADNRSKIKEVPHYLADFGEFTAADLAKSALQAVFVDGTHVLRARGNGGAGAGGGGGGSGRWYKPPVVDWGEDPGGPVATARLGPERGLEIRGCVTSPRS